MSGFELVLASPRRVEHVAAVDHFVGTDGSGRFGILPGRSPLVTALEYGLARFHVAEADRWRHVALPGGALSFDKGRLAIACRHFTVGDNAGALLAALADEGRREDARRADLRHNLDRFEQMLMRRLWEMER